MVELCYVATCWSGVSMLLFIWCPGVTDITEQNRMAIQFSDINAIRVMLISLD